MSEPLTVRRSIEKLIDGTIRIPGFQRPFVWEPQRAALLMDSVYKHFPVGSLLLWRTKNRLKTERRLGVFESPHRPTPTSRWIMSRRSTTTDVDLFDLSDSPTADRGGHRPLAADLLRLFIAAGRAGITLCGATAGRSRSNAIFSCNVFLEPVAFSRATAKLADAQHEEIVNVQQRFLGALSRCRHSRARIERA